MHVFCLNEGNFYLKSPPPPTTNNHCCQNKQSQIFPCHALAIVGKKVGTLHSYRCSSNWIEPHLILVEEFGKILKVWKNSQNHFFPTKALDVNDLHLDSSDDWIFFYVSVLQFLRGL